MVRTRWLRLGAVLLASLALFGLPSLIPVNHAASSPGVGTTAAAQAA
jgi:hypothetical protein